MFENSESKRIENVLKNLNAKEESQNKQSCVKFDDSPKIALAINYLLCVYIYFSLLESYSNKSKNCMRCTQNHAFKINDIGFFSM